MNLKIVMSQAEPLKLNTKSSCFNLYFDIFKKAKIHPKICIGHAIFQIFRLFKFTTRFLAMFPVSVQLQHLRRDGVQRVKIYIYIYIYIMSPVIINKCSMFTYQILFSPYLLIIALCISIGLKYSK